jgi:MSHA biogenesis protein MshI
LSFLGAFSRKPSPGLVVLRASGDSLSYVNGLAVNDSSGSAKPVILSMGQAKWDGSPGALARAFRGFGFGKNKRCAVLLASGEYQISAVEAPPAVQSGELKAAMRWRMKDVIDYPVDQAVFDILEIPGAQGGGAPSSLVYVIVARSELVKSYVQRFDEAKVPLEVVDVPETAQRNITTLYEPEGRGVGLLYFDDTGGLLTVTSGGDLYLVRRFDFTMNQIREATGAYQEDLFGRILVELQRTLDSFERQNSQIVLSRLMLGPQPEPTALGAYLRTNFGVSVDEVSLEDVVEFRGEAPDAESQWQYFHMIGCSIRAEAAQQ